MSRSRKSNSLRTAGTLTAAAGSTVPLQSWPSATRRLCGVGGVAAVVPPHRYDQQELAAIVREHLPDLDVEPEVLTRFFRRVGVRQRHLALPAAEYAQLDGLRARNDAWLRVGLELGERAVIAALDDAGLQPADISMLITTTVTGIAVPSLDARLMNRLPFGGDTKRMPLFGLGCLGGAAGMARAADYLAGHPDEAVLLLSVELCSLTVQRDDASTANIISAGLFGDGAAAVVLRGPDHRSSSSSTTPQIGRATESPLVVDSRSIFFPDTERVMGWDVVDGGFKVVLSPDVPTLVSTHVPAAIDGLLAAHGLDRSDVSTWISHPGGPAVIAALEEGLSLPPQALQPTRDHLASVGNLSSSSVLFLLKGARERRPTAGTHGVLLAMGPAFCAELVLLRW